MEGGREREKRERPKRRGGEGKGERRGKEIDPLRTVSSKNHTPHAFWWINWQLGREKTTPRPSLPPPPPTPNSTCTKATRKTLSCTERCQSDPRMKGIRAPRSAIHLVNNSGSSLPGQLDGRPGEGKQSNIPLAISHFLLCSRGQTSHG